MDFSVPFYELINVVALAEAAIFSFLLFSSRTLRSKANVVLASVFLMIVTVKLDQLYQGLGGLQTYPQFGFVLSPIQSLISAGLYFFVLAKVTPDFKFKRVHLWNLLPFVGAFVYYLFFYYLLSGPEKVDLISSGGLAEPVNRFVFPLLGDLIQLGYLLAAINLLKKYGVKLKTWFSRLEDRNLVWVRRVIVLWFVTFSAHMILTIVAGGFGEFYLVPVIFYSLNIIHFILINALMFTGIFSHFRHDTFVSPLAKGKYAASLQTPKERKALYLKANKFMEGKKPYLDPDLTLGQLADKLAVLPRELSEAINGEGQQNFYDFVNSFRVDEAKRLLAEEKNLQILEIAFAAGFNSKSVFNHMFRKHSGQTPSSYRKNY